MATNCSSACCLPSSQRSQLVHLFRNALPKCWRRLCHSLRAEVQSRVATHRLPARLSQFLNRTRHRIALARLPGSGLRPRFLTEATGDPRLPLPDVIWATAHTIERSLKRTFSFAPEILPPSAYFSFSPFQLSAFQHFTKVEREKFDYVKDGRKAWVPKIERAKLADVTPGKINGTN